MSNMKICVGPRAASGIPDSIDAIDLAVTIFKKQKNKSSQDHTHNYTLLHTTDLSLCVYAFHGARGEEGEDEAEGAHQVAREGCRGVGVQGVSFHIDDYSLAKSLT